MKNKNWLILLIAFSTFWSGCANYHLRKANTAVSNLQYRSAIDHYEKFLAKKDDHRARISLANCYRLTNDYKRSLELYEIVTGYPEAGAADYLSYARLLMNHGEHKEAKTWLKKYLEVEPNDIVATMLLASCNSVNQFVRDTTLYTLQDIDLSEFESAFGQVPYDKGIIFTADKKASRGKREPWTGKSYYDLYFSERDGEGRWISPVLLKGEINGRYHEGPATFSQSGDVVYFTRSNYYRSDLKANAKGESNLKIFEARLVDGKWTQLKEMPFNSDEYSVGHPCLAKDQKTLYFISDMPGGMGGTDIYRSVFDGAAWSKPENMGAGVNTPGNEMFPFSADDGTFYFSSDAHNTMGGLDVFATSYDQQQNRWLQPENLNYPLNSTKDDFAYYLKSDNRTGFVSSNRNEADNIYEFRKNDPTFYLVGKVTLKGKGTPMPGFNITLIDESNDPKNAIVKLVTDKGGQYKVRLKPNTAYTVYGSKENFFTKSVEVSTIGEKYSKTYTADFEGEEIILEKPIVLDNIYYDLDKWEIRPDAAKELDKLVKLLKDNPNISIEMGSHTDSRAGDRYNMILSDKRAKSAVDYLIFSGIDSSRLKYKGYGETKLVNHCKNDVKCTEEEHQQNRRTEFKVIKIRQEVARGAN